MTKNRRLVIVSLLTGVVVSRCTFAEFAHDNAEVYSLIDLQKFCEELAVNGETKADNHLLIDVSIDGADVLAFLCKAKASVNCIGEVIATTNGCGFIVCGVDGLTAHDESLDKAIAGLLAKIPSPAKLAEQKRAAAAKLLAEADQLAAKVAA